MKQNRMVRVNRLLKMTLAEMIPELVKDPRVTNLTAMSIMEVDTTPDLRHAKVYLSILGDTHEQTAALQVLHRARGYLRGELGRRVRLRCIPMLIFELDNRVESAARIEQILREISTVDGEENNDE